MEPTLINRILPLAKGNPGAITCLAHCSKLSNFSIDNFEKVAFMGPQIWLLFKYVCKCSHTLTNDTINEICKNKNYEMDINGNLRGVREYVESKFSFK